MRLITPDFGLFFWMLVAFGIVVFVLRKFAWTPILSGLRSREAKIAEALEKAEAANKAVAELEAKNLELAHQAQLEREQVILEARAQSEKIIEQARKDAKQQSELFMTNARLVLSQEEKELRRQLRQEIVDMTIKTTERILREHFAEQSKQREYVDRLVSEMMVK